MRGNFDEMYRYKAEIEGKVSIGTIIKISQNIIQAQEELPKRKHDLLTNQENVKDQKLVLYRRILKKDDKAVPVDLLENLGIIYLDGTQENEFLLPPFTFKITDIEQGEDFDTFDIEETGKINPRQLLGKRVDELEEYLKSNNRLEDYEKLKQIRDEILQKSKKMIKGYNVKDIYYGLRPKGKKSNKINDDFSDR